MGLRRLWTGNGSLLPDMTQWFMDEACTGFLAFESVEGGKVGLLGVGLAEARLSSPNIRSIRHSRTSAISTNW
jgi:hypothetical protein